MALIKDSQGRPSWHLTLGVPALIVSSVWFLTGGLDLTIGKFHLVLATRAGADYLSFAGVWLAALGWRDYTKLGLSAQGIEMEQPAPVTDKK